MRDNALVATFTSRCTRHSTGSLVADGVGVAAVCVLVVDDYEPWRRFVPSAVQRRPELVIVGEALDGLEAVQKAQQLQPDLILPDVGLPTLRNRGRLTTPKNFSRVQNTVCESRIF
jgi:PleD family two-component response regulator